MPDFTYQDCDGYVLLTAHTERAGAKIRDDIRPADSYSGIVAILNPEEGKRVRCILTVYEGFTVETITPMTTTSPLPSTIDSPQVRKRVEAASRQAFGQRRRHPQHVFFEHGHWWVRVSNTRRDDAGDPVDITYDIVDASGPGSYNGFSFEEIE